MTDTLTIPGAGLFDAVPADQSTAAKLAVIDRPNDAEPLPPPKRRACYVPKLADGTRQWILEGGTTVTAPHWDDTTGVFRGLKDGQPWSSPWVPELTWLVASQVPGCCIPEQGRTLYSLASQAPARTVHVEIGCALGLSAVWIGWGALSRDPGNRDTTRLHCIDTFQGPRRGDGYTWSEHVRDEFEDNLAYAGILPVTTVHEEPSEYATKKWTGGPIGFLYVDALHSYAAVKGDHRNLEDHLATGAIVAFDDAITGFPSVLKYMRELAQDPNYELMGATAALVAWKKTA